MQERNSLRKGASLLGILLLSLSTTAAAVETGAGSRDQAFNLELEQSIGFGEPLEAESAETIQPAAATWSVGISAAELRGSEVVVEAQAEANATPKSGGFGRWLKKRWYIPVLAAVLIGVLAGDDDDNGEDSDD